MDVFAARGGDLNINGEQYMFSGIIQFYFLGPAVFVFTVCYMIIFLIRLIMKINKNKKGGDTACNM